jgi:hypothetical protein
LRKSSKEMGTINNNGIYFGPSDNHPEIYNFELYNNNGDGKLICKFSISGDDENLSIYHNGKPIDINTVSSQHIEDLNKLVAINHLLFSSNKLKQHLGDDPDLKKSLDFRIQQIIDNIKNGGHSDITLANNLYMLVSGNIENATGRPVLSSKDFEEFTKNLVAKNSILKLRLSEPNSYTMVRNLCWYCHDGSEQGRHFTYKDLGKIVGSPNFTQIFHGMGTPGYASCPEDTYNFIKKHYGLVETNKLLSDLCSLREKLASGNYKLPATLPLVGGDSLKIKHDANTNKYLFKLTRETGWREFEKYTFGIDTDKNSSTVYRDGGIPLDIKSLNKYELEKLQEKLRYIIKAVQTTPVLPEPVVPPAPQPEPQPMPPSPSPLPFEPQSTKEIRRNDLQQWMKNAKVPRLSEKHRSDIKNWIAQVRKDAKQQSEENKIKLNKLAEDTQSVLDVLDKGAASNKEELSQAFEKLNSTIDEVAATSFTHTEDRYSKKKIVKAVGQVFLAILTFGQFGNISPEAKDLRKETTKYGKDITTDLEKIVTSASKDFSGKTKAPTEEEKEQNPVYVHHH